MTDSERIKWTKRIDEVETVRAKPTFQHEAGRYEGDGDPGCVVSCPACYVDLLHLRVGVAERAVASFMSAGDPDFDSMLRDCVRTLESKGVEYTAGSPDRLANFRNVAAVVGVREEDVWFTYFYKHYSAIVSFIKTGETRSNEPIRGRIMDAIVYLLLFSKMVEERGRRARPTAVMPASQLSALVAASASDGPVPDGDR